MAGTNADERADASADLLTILARCPIHVTLGGVRYALAGMLTIAVCAVVAGAKSFAAMGEFAAHLDGDQLGRPGLGKALEESTLRKVFARVDAAAFDAALAVYAGSSNLTGHGCHAW